MNTAKIERIGRTIVRQAIYIDAIILAIPTVYAYRLSFDIPPNLKIFLYLSMIIRETV